MACTEWWRAEVEYAAGGLLYFPGDSDEASLNPALNTAMLMFRYTSAGLATSTSNQNRYEQFAQRQLDYVLGNNPMFGTHACITLFHALCPRPF